MIDFLAEPELDRNEAIARLEAHYAAGIASEDAEPVKLAIRLECDLSLAVLRFMEVGHRKMKPEIALQLMGAALAGAAVHMISACDTPTMRKNIANYFREEENVEGYVTGASFLVLHGFEQELAKRAATWDEGQSIRIKPSEAKP